MASTREPQEIREEIADTREQLGETVEALASKADVKGQAKAKVEDVKQRIGGAAPDSAKGAATSAAGTVQQKPLPFAVAAAFAIGAGLGLLIGRRR